MEDNLIEQFDNLDIKDYSNENWVFIVYNGEEINKNTK